MTEPLNPIEAVLAASLDMNSVQDVCFYAFSKRTKVDGVVKMHHPRPVVAIGSLLENTPGMANMFAVACAKSAVDSGDAPSSEPRPFSIRQTVPASDYGYDSDSDLDDEELVNLDCLSDDGTTSEDTFVLGSEEEGASTVTQSDNKYRNIMVANIAARTLRAGIFFAYTGKVTFLPLQSQGLDKWQSQLRALDASGMPACSPKSLYRFADTYDMKDLRQRAANAITHRLSPENIVEEVFSTFFCRYADLHKRAMDIIALLYDNATVQQSLERMVPRLVKGELPHAGPTLVALLQMQKVDPQTRRLAQLAIGAAVQSAPITQDTPSPFGTSLNPSAQSFRPQLHPAAPTPAFGSGVHRPSPAGLSSQLSRPIRSPIRRPPGPDNGYYYPTVRKQ